MLLGSGWPGLWGAKLLYNRAAVEFVSIAGSPVALAAASPLMTAVRQAAVSWVTVSGVPTDLNRSPCRERKKNNLSFTMGPPRVTPNWLKRKAGSFVPV